MKIRVLQKHIQNGKQGNETKCPLALAMLDAGVEYPQIGEDVFWIDDDPTERVLPEEAAAWVKDFDEGYEVKPREFIIDVKARKEEA